MVRAMRRVLLCLAAAALTGCFYPADRGQLIETRVDGVADETHKLEAQLKSTQEKLDQQTARLQEALDQLDKASRTTGANIGVRVDSAIQDVAMVRGQIESNQHRLQELESRLTDAEGKLEKAQALARSDKADAKPEEKKDEVKRPDNPKDFLKLADDKAKAGDLELARKLYTEFMKKWPREETVGEAHFALGETYFGEQKCREALYEYGKVIQDFPKTKSVPNAYLRSADCFKELKMSSESKLALDELVKQHPKSDAAKTAKQRLADLEKKPAPEKDKTPPKKGNK